MKLAWCRHEIELGIDLEHRSPRQVAGHQWRQHATTGTSSTEARTQHGLRWWRGWADGLRGLEPDESNPGPTCHAAWDGLVYGLDWVPTAPRTGWLERESSTHRWTANAISTSRDNHAHWGHDHPSWSCKQARREAWAHKLIIDFYIVPT